MTTKIALSTELLQLIQVLMWISRYRYVYDPSELSSDWPSIYWPTFLFFFFLFTTNITRQLVMDAGFWGINWILLGSIPGGTEVGASEQKNSETWLHWRECKVLEWSWYSGVWFSSLVDSLWRMEFVRYTSFQFLSRYWNYNSIGACSLFLN